MKDLVCKCGSTTFYMMKRGKATGLYCKECGKWRKWMNKDDINLAKIESIEEVRNEIDEISGYDVAKMCEIERSCYNCPLGAYYDKVCKPMMVDIKLAGSPSDIYRINSRIYRLKEVSDES